MGSNGNYWSASYNNSNNAYNVWFNDSNLNPQNNNNRNNGQSVRLVRSAQHYPLSFQPLNMLTREQLLEELYLAYYEARRHKRNKPYQLRFEARLEENLASLCASLMNRTYRPLPSDCFIITDPKRREVFAAHFRDRIVHHLYYNYTHEMFERTFIQDCYSCIKHRGTHYGVNRLSQHILKESQNYTRPCYVLKMDIRGYFMNINRAKLLDICIDALNKMGEHCVGKYRNVLWKETVDMDFVRYLTETIVMLDPAKDCRVIGQKNDWDELPHSKSLFHSPKGCGLPIGNLTSQLFSNVYLNRFDQFMKRTLHCRHYGRYVDDFYVVSCDSGWLESLVPVITIFLSEQLGLTVHEGKTEIRPITKGVEFLGAFVLPYRIYVSRNTLQRMDAKMELLETIDDVCHIRHAIQSYRGVLSHWNNHRVGYLMFQRHFFRLFSFFSGLKTIPLCLQ